MKVLTREEYAQVKILEKVKEEIDEMLKSDEVSEDKFSNVIINKSYLFRSIINKNIAELKGENK